MLRTHFYDTQRRKLQCNLKEGENSYIITNLLPSMDINWNGLLTSSFDLGYFLLETNYKKYEENTIRGKLLESLNC